MCKMLIIITINTEFMNLTIYFHYAGALDPLMENSY